MLDNIETSAISQIAYQAANGLGQTSDDTGRGVSGAADMVPPAATSASALAKVRIMRIPEIFIVMV
jgi:hypothetical protein